MHRRLALILAAAVATIGVLIASNLSTPAQDPPPDDGIAIVPRWKAGETRTYEMVKSRKTNQGKTKREGSCHSLIEVSVIEAGAKGYLIGWTIQETRLDDPEADRNPMFRQIADLVKGWKALIEVDEEASITGVRNWQELQARGKQLVDLMSGNLKTLGLEPAMMEKVRTQVESMFAGKDQVEQFFIREPQVFFLPIGRTYPGAGALDYDADLLNPLGGEPLPSRGKLTLASIDRKTNRARVRWSQTVDSDAARRVMLETIRNLSEKVGKPVPDPEKIKSMAKSAAVEDRGEFTIDTESGWVEELTHTRTTTVGQATTREEIVTIKHVVATPSP
jgi:hypothetical protein